MTGESKESVKRPAPRTPHIEAIGVALRKLYVPVFTLAGPIASVLRRIGEKI